MTTNVLPYHYPIRPATLDEDIAKEAASVAEFLILEQCVLFCESLADQLDARGPDALLRAELSDSTTACEAYVAAKLKESRFEGRLAASCVAMLAKTAQSCRMLEGPTAKRCRIACEIAIAFIEDANPSTTITTTTTTTTTMLRN